MVHVTIKTDNAAFEGDPRFEVARILRQLARKVELNGLEEMPIMDVNGNRVGDLVVK